MFEAQQATLPTKRGVYARFIPEEKAEVGKRACSTASRAWRGRDCPGSAYVLPKSGLGTSGLGSTSIYVRMSEANRIDPRKLFPRNACGRPIREIFAPQKYSAIRYVRSTYFENHALMSL